MSTIKRLFAPPTPKFPSDAQPSQTFAPKMISVATRDETFSKLRRETELEQRKIQKVGGLDGNVELKNILLDDHHHKHQGDDLNGNNGTFSYSQKVADEDGNAVLMFADVNKERSDIAYQCHAALGHVFGGSEERVVGLREAKMREILNPIGQKLVEKGVDSATNCGFLRMNKAARSMCLYSAFLDKLDNNSLLVTTYKQILRIASEANKGSEESDKISTRSVEEINNFVASLPSTTCEYISSVLYDRIKDDEGDTTGYTTCSPQRVVDKIAWYLKSEFTEEKECVVGLCIGLVPPTQDMHDKYPPCHGEDRTVVLSSLLQKPQDILYEEPHKVPGISKECYDAILYTTRVIQNALPDNDTKERDELANHVLTIVNTIDEMKTSPSSLAYEIKTERGDILDTKKLTREKLLVLQEDLLGLKFATQTAASLNMIDTLDRKIKETAMDCRKAYLEEALDFMDALSKGKCGTKSFLSTLDIGHRHATSSTGLDRDHWIFTTPEESPEEIQNTTQKDLRKASFMTGIFTTGIASAFADAEDLAQAKSAYVYTAVSRELSHSSEYVEHIKYAANKETNALTSSRVGTLSRTMPVTELKNYAIDLNNILRKCTPTSGKVVGLWETARNSLKDILKRPSTYPLVIASVASVALCIIGVLGLFLNPPATAIAGLVLSLSVGILFLIVTGFLLVAQIPIVPTIYALYQAFTAHEKPLSIGKNRRMLVEVMKGNRKAILKFCRKRGLDTQGLVWTKISKPKFRPNTTTVQYPSLIKAMAAREYFDEMGEEALKTLIGRAEKRLLKIGKSHRRNKGNGKDKELEKINDLQDGLEYVSSKHSVPDTDTSAILHMAPSEIIALAGCLVVGETRDPKNYTSDDVAKEEEYLRSAMQAVEKNLTFQEDGVYFDPCVGKTRERAYQGFSVLKQLQDVLVGKGLLDDRRRIPLPRNAYYQEGKKQKAYLGVDNQDLISQLHSPDALQNPKDGDLYPLHKDEEEFHEFTSKPPAAAFK